MAVAIRDYDVARDRDGVRARVVELQDEERAVYPESPRGEDIADEYLAWIDRRVAEHDGRRWVADDGGRIVGFVCVLARVPRSDPDDPDPVHAEVSEITLDPAYRGDGLGARLLAIAEAHARDARVSSIRIGHHGRNDGAHRFYEREGYETLAVLVGKRLAPPSTDRETRS